MHGSAAFAMGEVGAKAAGRHAAKIRYPLSSALR
jgi:hypothetical protein